MSRPPGDAEGEPQRRPGARRRPAAPPSDPRAVALAAIRRVVDGGAYSNLVVPAVLARSGLDERDRHLAAELAFGTIRRLLSLDRAIAARSSRPLDRITPRALHLLRLGAYQLLHLRVPPHAAVAETVALAGPRERGFVNAVLRAIAADPPPPPAGSSDEDVAARTGLAAWAVGELRRLLPPEEVEPAAAAIAGRGPLTLRPNPCRTTPEALEAALRAAGHEPRRGGLLPDALLLDGGRPEELPGFAEGWFVVQDQASGFVADALEARAGERVLDACAAPGGKAVLLACRVSPGGRLVAADVSPKRTALVRRAAARLGVRVLVLAQDARRPALREGFDRALVDAPCSGIGAARRRPELLWRPRREELSGLARLQVAIAEAVAGLLRPGGRLVYSVCTFPRAETDAACDALLRRRPDLEPAPVVGPEGPAPRVRLWPHRHGTDAMFVAAFRRLG
ncbi:MAG TPA: transcription antitermination factor NusB [Actinomycetota bacterium]|nr:transcription antitermination factor NusB [Actinomycetota bacterium]